MILTQVEITNYKQYGGYHNIPIPQTGAIGVIGANGVGKTTLFEAIEWALYAPRAIASADVKPRIWRGKTEVKVTLDNPVSGARFIVEREIGKGSAKARIYRVDQFGFEEKIVDGAVQVTTYVTNHLIGLDHSAFVATFFTRQKELGFFNGSKTDRRRDVGKLLGLQTIRNAQQLIAEDRKRTQADARSYRAQSEAESRDRDFQSEIATAEASISEARQIFESASAIVTSSTETTKQAEEALAAITQVREQDTALNQAIGERARERDVANEKVAASTRELDRLDTLTTQRTKLEPIVARLKELESEEQAQDVLRQKALRKRELEQAAAAHQRRDEEAINSTRELISGTTAPDGNRAWNVDTPADAVDWATGIDLSALETRATRIANALEVSERLIAEQQVLSTWSKRMDYLLESQQKILASGDPHTHLQEARTRFQELNGSTAAAISSVNRIGSDLKRTESILANLRAQHEGEICPTCQRPFTSGETSHAIAVFERDVQQQRQTLGQINAQIDTNKKAIVDVEAQIAQLSGVAQELEKTRSSIEVGNQHLDQQKARVEDLAVQLQHALQTLGRSTPPTAQERDSSRQEVAAWRKVAEAGTAIRRLLQLRAQIASEREPILQALQSFTSVTYDEAEHRNIIKQLQESQQAQSTIMQIDKDLARREQLLIDKETSASIVAQTIQDIAKLQQERDTLGFSLDAYQQAQASVRAAQGQERVATEQRHRAEIEMREAENRLSLVLADQDRVSRLATEAEAKQREADDLDLMYKEFTEFERFAAAWYAPRLSEIASDLVSQVTDGKYDRVEFDNNFSIEVFDGDDEKYPYETFSGGERDAIALCARIALSRVIGGASTSPPGFLVLDEVFGSLDLERRQRLLEMLAAITGADDHFRQVFIISHVDDVRTSPILDDIWRITETEDGTSELQPLGVGVDIGEL